MDQRERMNAGLPYKAWLDGLDRDRLEAKKKTYAFNRLPPGGCGRFRSYSAGPAGVLRRGAVGGGPLPL